MNLLKKKSIFMFFGVILFLGGLVFSGAKVSATGFFDGKPGMWNNCYWIAKNKDVSFAQSRNADNSIRWHSSNTNVVTVSEYGVIHAKNKGEAKITATEPNGNVSECTVIVINEDPIRIAYPSNSIVGVNKEFEAVAITPRNVESVKFVFDGPGRKFESVSRSKRTSGNVLVWTKKISIGRAGTARVKTYAKIKGKWYTRDEGNFNVKIVNSYDKNTSSLQERAVTRGAAKFIASCEGFVDHVYKDPANILTVGYGKVVNPYEQFYNNITKDEGLAVFLKLLSQGTYARSVNNFLKNNGIKYNQHQFDGLVSFCYNLGCGWLNNGSDLSNILKNCGRGSNRSLNNINKDAFANEMLCYHHAGGKCLAGLVYRRFHEVDMILYNKYSLFREGKPMNYGNYEVPECARGIVSSVH